MKRNYTPIFRLLSASVMLFLVSAITLIGQTPSTINYHALLRDTDGNPRANVSVSLELDIHQGTVTGAVVYSETHNTTTSDFGLVNLEIGSVSPANFALIDWSAGPYFVEVSVDGTSMGASELLTVPYALHAGFAESVEITGSEAAFAAWDKNEADDFNGAFGSLTGIPADIADGDDDTHLSEGQVEAYIDGDETSFNGWDKNAADDFSGAYGDLSGRPDLSEMIAISGAQDGDIAYYRSGDWTRLPRGTDGEKLYMDGGLPDWRASGDVGVQAHFQFVVYHAPTSILPIAHGFVNSSGTVISGTGNFTCSWDATIGRYIISITGHSYFYNNYTTVITLSGGGGYGAAATTDSLGGNLLIYIRR